MPAEADPPPKHPEVFQAGKGFVQHPHLSRELLRIRHRPVCSESQLSFIHWLKSL